MHLACSGGTAEAGEGGGGGGGLDSVGLTGGRALKAVWCETADQVAPSRHTAWAGRGGDNTHMI
jgi:hypothetical protein